MTPSLSPADVTRMPFLDALGAESRDGLLGRGRARRYPIRSFLFFEEDEPNGIFAIKAGLVKLTINVDGHEVLLDVLGPGDILGELSVIEGVHRSATATAITAVDTTVIPGTAFMAAVAEDPRLAISLLQMVAGRVRGASRRQVEYGALDAVGRVCRRLIEMAERYGTPGRRGVIISGPLTQGEIAAWAGLSREAVVKALHALRNLGWVHTSPRSITLVDVDAVLTRASLHHS